MKEIDGRLSAMFEVSALALRRGRKIDGLGGYIGGIELKGARKGSKIAQRSSSNVDTRQKRDTLRPRHLITH